MRRPLKRCFLSLLLSSLLAVPTSLGAQEVPLLLSLQGGISYGAYQAGVNQAILDVAARATRDSIDFRLAGTQFSLAALVGASAGNINGLLSAITWCRPVTAVEESVLWKVWISTGLPQLLDRVEPNAIGRLPDLSADADGVLHRRFFQKNHFEMLRELAGDVPTRKLSEECDDGIPVGLTLTRQQPDSIPITSGRPGENQLFAPVQRYVTAFYLKREGGTLVWKAPDKSLAGEQGIGKMLFLPADEDGLIDSDDIFAAVEASSAFPAIFGPKRLTFVDGDRDRLEEAWFLDGGIFDNNPLGLGFSLVRYPDSLTAPPAEMSAVFIDPGRRRIDRTNRQPELRPHVGLDEFAKLVLSGVAPARKYELHALARAEPQAWRNAIAVTTRWAPVYGSTLHAIGAFLGQPLREYDFYSGFYDGLKFMVESWGATNDCAPETLRSACERTRIAKLIDAYAARSLIRPGGMDILRRHLADEYGGVPADSLALATHDDAAAKDLDQSQRAELLAVVAQAAEYLDLRTIPAARSDAWCSEGSFMRSWGCEQGLIQALDHIRVQGAEALDYFRHERAPGGGQGVRRSDCNDADALEHFHSGKNCFVDDYFARLVEEPDERLNDFARQVLWRLKGLAELKADCEGRCANGYAAVLTPAREEVLIEALLALLELPPERRGLSLNPTRIPSRIWLLRLAPTELVVVGFDQMWDVTLNYRLGWQWAIGGREIEGYIGVGPAILESETQPLELFPTFNHRLAASATVGLRVAVWRGSLEIGNTWRAPLLWERADQNPDGYWGRVSFGPLFAGLERTQLCPKAIDAGTLSECVDTRLSRFMFGMKDPWAVLYWIQRYAG